MVCVHPLFATCSYSYHCTYYLNVLVVIVVAVVVVVVVVTSLIAHADHALASSALATIIVRIFSAIAVTYVLPVLPHVFVSVTSVTLLFVPDNICGLLTADVVVKFISSFASKFVSIAVLHRFAFPRFLSMRYHYLNYYSAVFHQYLYYDLLGVYDVASSCFASLTRYVCYAWAIG